MSLRLRALHKMSALFLGLFLAAHIGNHLYGIGGQQAHMNYTANARLIYRNSIVEPLLLTLIAWQAGSGLILLWRSRLSKRSVVGWLQQLSGLYLAIFLLIHVAAVISGRMVYGLDTDFRFAAAGFHVGNFSLFFAPYYFLAVLSLFAHVGCALYWNLTSLTLPTRKSILGILIVIGAISSLLVVMSLAGMFYEVDIPAAYRGTYDLF